MFKGVNWADAAERAIRTFVQAASAAMLVELAGGGGWNDIPVAASVGAFAGFLSLLMMVAGPLKPSSG